VVAKRLLLEGAQLGALLAQVGDELGPDARVVRADRVRTGGFAGFFQREHYELTVEVPDRPAPSPRPRRLAGIDALLDRADAADDASALPGGTGPTVDDVPTVSTGGEAFADVLEQVKALAADRGNLPTAVHRPVRAEVVLPPPPEPVEDDTVVRRLAELGVPEAFLTSRPTTIGAWARGLPPAAVPSRQPGAVLVLAGPAAAVDVAATVVADRLDLPAEAVVSAGTAVARAGTGRARPTRQRPGDVEAATAWRATASSAAHAWVVALAVADGPQGRAEGRDLLRALAPAQAWAVVDARSRTADARLWLDEVGPFDALAVRGMFDTAEPGAVLGLGLPVAWFDGVPATPTAWASAFDRASGRDDDAGW